MSEHESSRTLVKSAPELWAECSDPAALARHLGSVGEIRITRLEPETTVAWEGTAARGTVELEPAGWGTRVTLTMTEIEEGGARASTTEAVAEPVSTPAPDADGEPVSTPAPDADNDPEAVPAAGAQVADTPRRGWLARLLTRLRGSSGGDLDATADTPEPQPRAQPAEAPAEAPSPVSEAAEEPAPLGGESALRAALDSLGRAHHRPYSRA